MMHKEPKLGSRTIDELPSRYLQVSLQAKLCSENQGEKQRQSSRPKGICKTQAIMNTDKSRHHASPARQDRKTTPEVRTREQLLDRAEQDPRNAASGEETMMGNI